MKNLILIQFMMISLVVLAFTGPDALSQTTKKSSTKSKASKKIVQTNAKKTGSNKSNTVSTNSVSQRAAPRNSQIQRLIQVALNQIRGGQYIGAANNLLALSRRADMISERPQIKYYLGVALMELNLNQVASFQFVDVIRSKNAKYLKAALEKLLIVTDRLGDETLLNFALQRIDVSSIPAQHRDMLYFRMGEIQEKGGNYEVAIKSYSRVGNQSRYFLNALYNMGLTYSESGQLNQALTTFRKLYAARQNAEVTDSNRVSAQMGIARVLYQQQKWDESVDAYSEIPRDHRFWHDSIFERSWAMMRSGRFRSSLSNFHSLHSSFYDNFYIPESLLLRSIVYLYICKYDEMEKVLDLYDKQYQPVESKIDRFIRTRKLAESYYSEVEKSVQLKRNPTASTRTLIPAKALNHVSEEGNVRRMMAYIKKVQEERVKIDRNSQIKSSSLGSYSSKLLNNRIKNAKIATGEMIKAHLQNMLTELKDLKDQTALIRYEMINGKKETIKKRIVGKNLGEAQVDGEVRDRSFYVQNGYEYYPFQGEYWLDEIGNYHYLGKQSCE
jgi:tetratricopeptide (TPR) repeat protein